jgi:hypothetical protein
MKKIPREAREAVERVWCQILEERTGVPHQIVRPHEARARPKKRPAKR